MSLLSHFTRRIRLMGPISIGEFMKDVISDPQHGYYPQAARIGHKGDFITAPELTPVFGEIVAAWALVHWEKVIKSNTISFTELGPGRGTLMKDILETTGIIGPAFFGKPPILHGNLIEISEKFIAEQEKTLCGNVKSSITPEIIFNNPNYLKRTGVHKSFLNWFSLIDYLPRPSKPNIFICNEFFDALPIQQFERTESGWVEILIDVNDDDTLRYTTYKTNDCIKIDNDDKYINFKPGTQIEISHQSEAMVTKIAERISEFGGFALIIDYGDSEINDLTFRAFRNHEQVNPLNDIGLCDLTADVNFSSLKSAAETVSNIRAYGPITQSNFLTLMGIGERFRQLYSIVPPDKQEAVIHAHNFLCSPDEMGDRFKVMCIGRNNDPTPLCFE